MEDGASFFTGTETTNSAKKRRQDEYRQDLQLQMREKDAARLRERFQGMHVNASGWLDPEKRPDRLKSLGNLGPATDRREKDTKVRAYHTLFNYGKRDGEGGQTQRSERGPNSVRLQSLFADSTVGLHHIPLTEATVGLGQPHDSVNTAYNYLATKDLDRPGVHGSGSLIQPLVIPYVDNRPIIVSGRSDSYRELTPRYNPFLHGGNNGNGNHDVKSTIDLSQLENSRLKAQLARDNEEFQRRMRKELEDERRKLMDREAQARHKMEEIRREYEERKRAFERQQRHPARPVDHGLPRSAPLVIRPPSTTLLSDMDDQRKRLIEERRVIEGLLRAQRNQPNYQEVKVLKRPPPPPTPRDPDRPNRRNVEEFTYLKHSAERKTAFRQRYPDIPSTNTRLEHQQRALIRQQEDALCSIAKMPPPPIRPVNRIRYTRPDWMDRSPTPFPHRLRQRDRLYTTNSVDRELDNILRKTERRDEELDKVKTTEDIDAYESFRMRSHRPLSTETLTDETWLRPSSVAAF